MPYDDPDPTDPLTLHGVGVETDDDEAMRDMACCFIEEYARLGFDVDRIRQIFLGDEFAGPALARRVLGDSVIRAMIDEEVAKWGPKAPGRLETTMQPGGLGLPVLE